MTPQEQELISQLFARLKQTPPQQQDAGAAELIAKQAAAQPDSIYKLAQTVLMQDMALRQAEARLAEFERGPGSASFLPSAPRGSVPASGPWQRDGAPSPAAPSPWAAPMAGGGSNFLRTAAATALGVVGGQFLFQGLSSMFGQNAGFLAGQPLQPSITETVVNNFYRDRATADPGGEAGTQSANADDAGYMDASDSEIASNDDWNDNNDFA